MSSRRPSLSQRSELIWDVHTHSINVDTREIFLHGHVFTDEVIDGEPGVDYRMATTFIKNLRILDYLEEKPILVHMLTCGGCWNFGMAIYDAIKSSHNHVTVLAYAHSRSMSSIIPQAADIRVIMPNCDFLIHFGTEELSGNYTSVISSIKWSEYIAERMLDIYVEKCKEGEYWRRHNMLTEKDIKEWLRHEMHQRQEFYMSARESVNMGFYDGVFGDEKYESVKDLLS